MLKALSLAVALTGAAGSSVGDTKVVANGWVGTA